MSEHTDHTMPWPFKVNGYTFAKCDYTVDGLRTIIVGYYSAHWTQGAFDAFARWWQIACEWRDAVKETGR